MYEEKKKTTLLKIINSQIFRITCEKLQTLPIAVNPGSFSVVCICACKYAMAGKIILSDMHFSPSNSSVTDKHYSNSS